MNDLRARDVFIEALLSLGRWAFALTISAVLVIACVSGFQEQGFHVIGVLLVMASIWGIGTALQICVEEDSDSGVWGDLIEWRRNHKGAPDAR